MFFIILFATQALRHEADLCIFFRKGKKKGACLEFSCENFNKRITSVLILYKRIKYKNLYQM